MWTYQGNSLTTAVGEKSKKEVRLESRFGPDDKIRDVS